MLFLKAAFDDGNKGLEGLERAHVAARGGGEQLLNFPLSSYTCQPPFWEALDDLSYGQLVVELRCRRDLARVSAWLGVPGLAPRVDGRLLPRSRSMRPPPFTAAPPGQQLRAQMDLFSPAAASAAFCR